MIFFFTSCGYLIPLLGLTPSGLFMVSLALILKIACEQGTSDRAIFRLFELICRTEGDSLGIFQGPTIFFWEDLDGSVAHAFLGYIIGLINLGRSIESDLSSSPK